VIRSNHFHDLLDCLAGQFFENQSARCTGTDFGINISLAAKSYFSIAIISEALPQDMAVLGVLTDDSAKSASRNGYTFTIYIDIAKITGPYLRPLFLLILAHEICHFAYYYELFIWLGDTTGIRAQNEFKYHISNKLIDAVTEEDVTYQTVIDEHNIEELINTFGDYNKNHFAQGSRTVLDYLSYFRDFLEHLRFREILTEIRGQDG